MILAFVEEVFQCFRELCLVGYQVEWLVDSFGLGSRAQTFLGAAQLANIQHVVLP